MRVDDVGDSSLGELLTGDAEELGGDETDSGKHSSATVLLGGGGEGRNEVRISG